MAYLKPRPLPPAPKADPERVVFLHDLLNELAGIARAGQHDFLAYLIGMARLEAARLVRGGD